MCNPPRDPQLPTSSVMRLAELKRAGDRAVPCPQGSDGVRIAPVEKRPEFLVLILYGRPGKPNAAESVDVVHGFSDIRFPLLNHVAFVGDDTVPGDLVDEVARVFVCRVGCDHDLAVAVLRGADGVVFIVFAAVEGFVGPPAPLPHV